MRCFHWFRLNTKTSSKTNIKHFHFSKRKPNEKQVQERKTKILKRFSSKQQTKSLFKNYSQQHWNLWLKNRQLNTFANWHHTMDEDSTKINVFEIALNNQKEKWKLWQWKPKDQKDKFQESVNQQLSWNKEVDGHKAVLSSKQKVIQKQD